MSKLLRMSDVCELTGLHRATIYTLPDFPKPIKLGARAVAWIPAEVDAWVEKRMAEREAA